MGYLGNYRNLGQTAAVIQARLPAQLHARCGAAGRAARHRRSDSPFRLRPNYAISSGLYGLPASARRATARRGRKLSSVLAALLFAASGAAQATIINARSPSLVDVSAAIASAVDGDTVIVPSGPAATWTSSLTIDKAISLIGGTTTDTVAGTAVDNTIISDNIQTTPGTSLIKIKDTSAGKSYRVSGFTFEGPLTPQNYNGLIAISGQSQAVRVDHCHFLTMAGQSAYFHIGDVVYGVADHNLIEGGHTQSFLLDNGGAFGNPAWAGPTDWGSANFFFMEDNYITNSSGIPVGATDGTFGCRWVFRHNHCYSVHIANHGTEGTVRGSRAQEVYKNDFHFAFRDSPGGTRSGGLLFYDNTWDGVEFGSNGMSLQAFRSFEVNDGQFITGWQAGDGSSPWDVNDTEGNGTYVEGHAPHLYFSGTAATGTNSTTIVDSGTAGWTTNQWVNFGAKRTSDGNMSIITGNTNNTLTVRYTGGAGSPGCIWAPGDPYQIHRVLVCLDQSGRGQGDLVTGTPGNFINSTTGTPAWPHEVLDPAYGWNNKKGTDDVRIVSPGNTFVENREYFNEAAPVGGVQTTGVGIGTLANRPASGVGGVDIAGVTPNPPGTAYWATDVSSINGSTDQGALYVWRGGAWVLYYRPYTYPHPLVSGVPRPPTNLRVVN